jgi:hypothetical protein
MDLGWKCLIPASLGLLLVVAGARLGKDGFYGWLALCASALGFLVLSRAVDIGRSQPQEGQLAELDTP